MNLFLLFSFFSLNLINFMLGCFKPHFFILKFKLDMTLNSFKNGSFAVRHYLWNLANASPLSFSLRKEPEKRDSKRILSDIRQKRKNFLEL